MIYHHKIAWLFVASQHFTIKKNSKLKKFKGLNIKSSLHIAQGTFWGCLFPSRFATEYNTFYKLLSFLFNSEEVEWIKSFVIECVNSENK